MYPDSVTSNKMESTTHVFHFIHHEVAGAVIHGQSSTCNQCHVQNRIAIIVLINFSFVSSSERILMTAAPLFQRYCNDQKQNALEQRGVDWQDTQTQGEQSRLP